MEEELVYTIADLSEVELNKRIKDIDQEVLEINELKSNNPVTVEDIEDCSDNYQWNLEWNQLLLELKCERSQLVTERNKFHVSD